MGGTPASKEEVQGLAQTMNEILAEVKKIHGAFPRNDNGETDFDGHREYHEAMIRAAEAQAEFWKELRLDIAKKGLWGLIITIGTLIVIGLSTKLGFSHTLPH